MTLLITVFAAIVCTVVWYTSKGARELSIGKLCLMYWGAALMWLVVAVVEYMEQGAEEYFAPAASDMLNDSFLGLAVTALGLVIWLIIVLVKDPKGVIRNALKK